MAFLAIFALNFHEGVFTTTTSCFKMDSLSKILKKPTYCLCNFFYIFKTLDLIWPKMFCWFPMKYVIWYSSIDINVNCNLLVLKKIGKTSKNCNFRAQRSNKESLWVTPKIKNFFSEITRAEHKLSETFSFIKISYVLVEL